MRAVTRNTIRSDAWPVPVPLLELFTITTTTGHKTVPVAHWQRQLWSAGPLVLEAYMPVPRSEPGPAIPVDTSAETTGSRTSTSTQATSTSSRSSSSTVLLPSYRILGTCNGYRMLPQNRGVQPNYIATF